MSQDAQLWVLTGSPHPPTIAWRNKTREASTHNFILFLFPHLFVVFTVWCSHHTLFDFWQRAFLYSFQNQHLAIQILFDLSWQFQYREIEISEKLNLIWYYHWPVWFTIQLEPIFRWLTTMKTIDEQKLDHERQFLTQPIQSGSNNSEFKLTLLLISKFESNYHGKVLGYWHKILICFENILFVYLPLFYLTWAMCMWIACVTRGISHVVSN